MVQYRVSVSVEGRVHRGKSAYVAGLARRGRACNLRVRGLRARPSAANEYHAAPEFFQLLADILKLSEPSYGCLLAANSLLQILDGA
jgi:hypothetical protein